MRSSRNPGAAGRASAALLASPQRGNLAIAAEAGCTDETVRAARRALERLGQIPPYACGRPGPPPGPRPSRTRDAIAAGCTTPRQVADAAGVSIQAAWKALRSQPVPASLAEAAAAADTLTVVRSAPEPSGPRPCAPKPPGYPKTRDLPVQPAGWPHVSDAAVRLCVYWCPQLERCRAYALAHPELPGIIAGLDQSERAAGLDGPRTPPQRIRQSKRLFFEQLP